MSVGVSEAAATSERSESFPDLDAPPAPDPSPGDPSPAPAGTAAVDAATLPLICLSHLRWNFVYQRPQHLMSRFARAREVLFVEEPIPDDAAPKSWLEQRRTTEGVTVLVPRLPSRLSEADREDVQRQLLDGYLFDRGIERYVLWFYTPMAVGFARHLKPAATIYDCMDELSAFRGAPPEMLAREQELIDRAGLIFTGGRSLYEAKRNRHRNVHAFPSSVELDHFRTARGALPDPSDQATLPKPRLGFYGVLDERFDIALLGAVAKLKPDWQWVMLGPIVKIGRHELPTAPNIHYLGNKTYAELPAYLAGWDVALMPFARNESTRFISPTKTPEYLAAGKPVVSTSITDVIADYGTSPAVRIADEPAAFVAACEAALADAKQLQRLLAAADAAIAGKSWDTTFQQMQALIVGACH